MGGVRVRGMKGKTYGERPRDGESRARCREETYAEVMRGDGGGRDGWARKIEEREGEGGDPEKCHTVYDVHV